MGKLPDTQRPHRQRIGKEFRLAATGLLRAGQKQGTQIAPELDIARNLFYKLAIELCVKADDVQTAFNSYAYMFRQWRIWAHAS